MNRTDPLTALLDAVDKASETAPVTMGAIISGLGERSFAPVILVIALLMVSPISGIPGAPTVAGAIIVLVGLQSLVGREGLWLPDVLLRREMPGTRLRKAVEWLRKPAAWLDRHAHPRLSLLTTAPFRWAVMASCVVVAMGWPLLELLPFVTSFGAGAVSLLCFGLLTRDGLYIVLGYGVIAGLVATVTWIVWGG